MSASVAPAAPVRWAVPKPGRLARSVTVGRRPVPLDEATTRAVLQPHALAPTGQAATLPLGRRNDTVLVDTARGRVVVRRYPARLASEEVRHEHAIADEARRRGVPVPAVLRTRSGDSWVEVDGARYGVSAFVDGRSYSGCLLSPGVAADLHRTAGRLLARFHLELAGFRPAGRHHLGDELERVTPGGLRACLQTLDWLVRTGVGRRDEDAERWLAARGGRLAADLVHLDQRLRQLPLDRGVIHGDYGLHNVTFASDGHVTMHDLELARRDLLLVDLAAVLSRSSVRSGRAFLAGYQELRPLDDEAWAALPDLWRHYRLCGAVRSWHNHRRWGGRQRLETARRRLLEADRVARRGVDPWR
ncbi:phosphotransferase enzyme family protein [Egicoccus sp. AB-alg2]|uniref:phosphotransferase enzyme family protein n=1 Tax=Egicoccus sp. AB-alg2 TaxID=3242693 RepID=UPI00359F049F